MKNSTSLQSTQRPIPEELMREFRSDFVRTLEAGKIHSGDQSFAISMFHSLQCDEIRKRELDVKNLVRDLSSTFFGGN